MKSIVWKDDKKCAVAITVNLNGEYFWLSLDPDTINRPKTLSLGTFGIEIGLERVLDVLEEYDIKSTFFVPGAIIENYPDKIEMLRDGNHEIANYGYKHENFGLLEKDSQRKILEESNKIIKDFTGKFPRGFRVPHGEINKDTYDLLEEMGFDYDSSLMDDYLPYDLSIDDHPYNILEIPIQWQNYDFPYFGFNYSPAFPAGQGRIAPYSEVLENWIYEYEGYKEKGLCFVLQIDPQTMGTPGRILILKKFLDYIKEKDDTWIGTCEEIVDYIKK